MPNITDKFNKAGNGSGTYPVVGIVSANRAANEAILSCEDLTGWATDTPVHFSTYRLAQDGTVDTTSQTDWKGIVNGNTITNLTRIAGANDTGNSVGDYVEMNPTIGWLDDIITGLLASHKQDGTLKDGIVSTAKIADSAITTSKIDSSAVTTPKVNDGAITLAKQSRTSLYSDATGTTGTVTLSDSAANYSKIVIYYRSDDNIYDSVEVLSPNDKLVNLVCALYGADAVYLKGVSKRISGTSITTNDVHYGQVALSSGVSYSHSNNIYITSVVGYK